MQQKKEGNLILGVLFFSCQEIINNLSPLHESSWYLLLRWSSSSFQLKIRMKKKESLNKQAFFFSLLFNNKWWSLMMMIMIYYSLMQIKKKRLSLCEVFSRNFLAFFSWRFFLRRKRSTRNLILSLSHSFTDTTSLLLLLPLLKKEIMSMVVIVEKNNLKRSIYF